MSGEDTQPAEAVQKIAAMARGYELMQRAIWNMAGTSGAEASWYRNTALAITGRVDPLWKVEKLSNCSRPGDCLTQADKFAAALTPPETTEAAIDLLAALKLFVRAEKLARDGNPPQDADELIRIGEAAIAKAEGRS